MNIPILSRHINPKLTLHSHQRYQFHLVISEVITVVDQVIHVLVVFFYRPRGIFCALLLNWTPIPPTSTVQRPTFRCPTCLSTPPTPHFPLPSNARLSCILDQWINLFSPASIITDPAATGAATCTYNQPSIIACYTKSNC